MKTERRTRQVPETYNVYVADDGTEFLSRRDCESYEYKMAGGKRDILFHAVESIDDMPAIMWLIKDKEDFEYLKRVHWAYHDVVGNFTLPGWYIAEEHDGGDSRDWYTVDYAEDYVNHYQEILDYMKNYLV